MENAIQVNPPPPLVLGVTRQTTFTYLALVMALNFVRGGGGETLLRPCLCVNGIAR